MDNRELKIASNMLALAKGRKGGGKRSLMLRTIMPHLSQDVGDALADAIQRNDSAKFAKTWDRVKREIAAKLDKSKHHAHASASPAVPSGGAPVLTGEQIAGQIYENFVAWISGKKLPHSPETDCV